MRVARNRKEDPVASTHPTAYTGCRGRRRLAGWNAVRGSRRPIVFRGSIRTRAAAIGLVEDSSMRCAALLLGTVTV